MTRGFKIPVLPVAVAMLALGAVAPRQAGAAKDALAPIVIELSEPQSSDVFGCRVPVTVHYSGSPPLSWIDAVARAYSNGEILSSSGIDTAGHPLIRDETTDGAKYVTVPVQFDLTPLICSQMTAMEITLARCSFNDKPAEDCQVRLKLSSPGKGKVKFYIGKRPDGAPEKDKP